MKNSQVVIAFVATIFFSANILAATSEVTWTKPEKYHDIDAGDNHRAKFKQNVFNTLGKHFEKLASKLPTGYQLKVDVNDVDLAGDVNLSGIHRMRVVTDLYFPSMKFTFQLLDENNHEVKAGKVHLRDMNFLSGSTLRYRNHMFSYEKKMLDDWFSDELKQ